MERAARWVLVVLALSVFLPLLRPRPFFSPDEAYYAQVAREMSETGDFVVPRFDGRPWLEKPPLFYWLLAASFAVCGWGFAAAALLNGVATLLTAGLVAAHVSGSAGARAGSLALAAYVTMLGPALAAGTALTDPVLTLCTTASVLAFLRDRTGSAALSGVCLGMGILAKGPIAPLVVLPALVAAPATAQRRKARRLLVTLAVGLAVATPWHVLLAMRGLWTEYEAVFLQQQVFSRVLIAGAQAGPWWYYVPVLALVAFPWATPALFALWRWRSDIPRAEAAAIIVPLVALSFSTTKLAHYLLPVLPWLAAILGRGTAALWAGSETPFPRALPRLGGFLAAAGVAFVSYAARVPPFQGLVPDPMRFLLFGMALLCLVLAWLESGPLPRLSWVLWASIPLGLRALLVFWSLPYANSILVEDAVSRAIRAELPDHGVPVSHRYFRPYLVAYGARGWRTTSSAGQLRATLEEAAANRPALLVTPSQFEGEGRAAAKESGSVAREVARIRGLGLLGGPEVELALFRIERGEDPARWFADLVAMDEGDQGFSYLERNPWAESYRWTLERVSRLVVRAVPQGPATLRLRGWGYPLAPDRQHLALRLNGRELARMPLPREPKVMTIPVPAEALRAAPQYLELEVAPLLVPARFRRLSTDERALGLAVDWVALDPVSAGDRVAP